VTSEDPKSGSKDAARAPQSREERLAEALRANLRRRKAARKAGAAECGDEDKD